MAEWSPYVDGRVKAHVALGDAGACHARRTGGTEHVPRSCYRLNVDNYDGLGLLRLDRVSSTATVTVLGEYWQSDYWTEFEEATFWLQCVGTTIKVFNRLTPVERISVTDSTFTAAGAWGGQSAVSFEDMSAPQPSAAASVFGSINALGRRLVT